ncbi:MAG: fasciclin domain-containing protein [Nocardioides sp.]
MKLNTLARSSGLAAMALTLSFGLAACGGEEEPTTGSEETTSEAPAEEEPAEEAADAGADTFGPGCSAIPAEGAGSFNGMATEPVASAASANPLLETLVGAVDQAKLVEPLNSAPELTVFAPTNDAFAAVPKDTMSSVMSDNKVLSQVLTHHVVGQRISPDQLSGEFETLNGDMLTINGSGESATVGDDEKAEILCGNIQTANATVYVIDTVQTP